MSITCIAIKQMLQVNFGHPAFYIFARFGWTAIKVVINNLKSDAIFSMGVSEFFLISL